MNDADTTMGEAFSRAGHVSPARRLDELAREVLADADGNLHDAVEMLDIRIGNDGGLLRIVTAKVLHDCIRSYLAKMAEEMRSERVVPVGPYRRRKGRAGGQTAGATHETDAPGNNNGGHTGRDTQRPSAASDGTGQNAGDSHRLHAGPSELARKAAIRSAVVGANSLLMSFVVAGMPLKYATRSQLLSEARGHSMRARFLRIVASRIPDEGVVGDHLNDDIAADAMQKAKDQEMNNAE